MKKLCLLRAIGACVFTLVASSEHAAAYNIIDLGTLGGTISYGYGINDSRHVTGRSQITGDSSYHAFLHDGNTMHDLGTLGGTSSLGYDVNASGQVVGFSNTAGDEATHAFLYEDGSMQDLGTLGSTYSQGTRINDSGQVVGFSNTAGDEATRAFLYEDGSMQDLGTLGGIHSWGWGINASGQVIGDSYTTGNEATHAFLYEDGSMQDLGTLGGSQSFGWDINASGQVSGYSKTTSGDNHAFLYDGNSMQDLGTLGGAKSLGRGINASGQVVGRSQKNSGSAYHAFFYDGSSMLDLCVLVNCVSAGWAYFYEALAINDNGDIAGYGYINGEAHAFLIINDNNQPPVALDTSASANQFVATNWTPGVSDPNSDPLSCNIVSQPPANQGIASVSSDCSSGSYDPQGFAGPSTTFTYKTNDGSVDSNVATVNVSITANPPPVAEDVTMLVISDIPRTLDLSPYITDGMDDQDLSTLILPSSAINGTAISNGDGTVTYTASSGFSGSDVFRYTVDDAFGQTSNMGTVNVSVSISIPPIADPGGPYVGIVGSAVSFDGRGSIDLDGRVTSYAWNFGDGGTGAGFKPKHTYAVGGVYTVTLRVTDNDGDHSIPETTTATIAFLGDDSDNDGLPDYVEDANGNGIVDPGETDPLDFDSDNDGLTDGYEVNISGTDPNLLTNLNLLPGDMNGDGVVNAGDSVLHMREVLHY